MVTRKCFLGMVVAVTMALAIAVPNARAAVISEWKLDEVSGTIAEDSAGTNDGTLVNGPAWTVGMVGGGLSFDGVNDRVEVVAANTLNPSTGLTIEAWVKPNGSSSGQIVIARYNGWILRIHGLQVQLMICPGTSTVRHSWVYTGMSAPLLTVGQWTHILGTYDSSTQMAREYYNGVEVSSDLVVDVDSPPYTTITSIPSYPYDIMQIGAMTEIGWAKTFNGVIDNLRVYDSALSAADVALSYLQVANPAVAAAVSGSIAALDNELAAYIDGKIVALDNELAAYVDGKVAALDARIDVLEAAPTDPELDARVDALEGIVLDLPPGLTKQKDRNADGK